MRFNLVFISFAALLLSAATNSKVIAQERITADDMPENWQYASPFESTSPVDDAWWRGFDDAVLDSLISQGIQNNYDVLMASRRIEIARQSLRQIQAGYYPSLSASAGWTRARTSGATTRVPTAAMTNQYFDLGVDMNWEIDVFGKITSQAKQGKANVRASKAEFDGVMISVAAKIASAYFQLRTVQAEIDVLNRHIASQQHVCEITKARQEAGLASMLDVSQSLTTYYSTLASITDLKTSETNIINSLAVLLGVFPQDLDAMLRREEKMPDYHQLIAVGVPLELLRRRPDVIQAEAQLAGYAAAVGIAKKDFLPTLSLSGSIGTSARDMDNLFTKRSVSYTIAPTLSWTIFDGYSRSAAVASAKEQMQAGIDNYNLTIITAVEETESAMAAYANDLEYIEYVQQAADNARESLYLSLDLYKQGLTDFINVTNAQISLLQYSNQLVQAKGQALSDLVAIYQALGGGF